MPIMLPTESTSQKLVVFKNVWECGCLEAVRRVLEMLHCECGQCGQQPDAADSTGAAPVGARGGTDGQEYAHSKGYSRLR